MSKLTKRIHIVSSKDFSWINFPLEIFENEETVFNRVKIEYNKILGTVKVQNILQQKRERLLKTILKFDPKKSETAKIPKRNIIEEKKKLLENRENLVRELMSKNPTISRIQLSKQLKIPIEVINNGLYMKIRKEKFG